MQEEFAEDEEFISDTWTFEEYQKHELIPSWESDAFVDSEDIDTPEEISRFFIQLNTYEKILLNDNWSWMRRVVDYGDDFEDWYDKDDKEYRLYLVSTRKSEPETPCEYLWLKIHDVYCRWRQLETQCDWNKKLNANALEYIKKLENLSESYLNYTLANTVENLMRQISFLLERNAFMKGRLSQMEYSHQKELELISEALHLRGLRLSKNISGGYFIFDRI